MLAADTKSGLHHMRHDGNTLCAIQHIFRNAFIRSSGDFLQYSGSVIEPLLRIGFIFGERQAAQAERHYTN